MEAVSAAFVWSRKLAGRAVVIVVDKTPLKTLLQTASWRSLSTFVVDAARVK